MNLNISRDWLLRMAEKEANGVISVGGLVSRVGPPTDAERLRLVAQAIESALDDIGHYPCRLDEMTEREAQIAGMVGSLVGAMQYIRDVLVQPPRPSADRAGGGDGEGVTDE